MKLHCGFIIFSFNPLYFNFPFYTTLYKPCILNQFTSDTALRVVCAGSDSRWCGVHGAVSLAVGGVAGGSGAQTDYLPSEASLHIRVSRVRTEPHSELHESTT